MTSTDFSALARARLADEIGTIRKEAPKRVALRFTPTRIVSWDHRKLGSTY